LLEHLGLEVPVSFQNGALVLKPQSGKLEVLRAVLLSANHAREIVEKAREENVPYIVFRDFFEWSLYLIRHIKVTTSTTASG